jgi:enamine deaminase RidA (YjgF/YER057c/UK114 family)
MSIIEEKIKNLGYELPDKSEKTKIERAKVVGNLVFTSGNGPHKDGKPIYVGRVGREVSIDQGYEAARHCAINCLACIKHAIGDLDRIDEIVKVLGFVNSDENFHQMPAVINGFTDFLIELFGEKGRHSRSAIGTSNLPGNIPVEVEMIARLKDK